MQGEIRVRSPKHTGCFIARPSFRSDQIVAYGKDAEKVRKSAIKKGYSDPVVVFNPPKGAVCIY